MTISNLVDYIKLIDNAATAIIRKDYDVHVKHLKQHQHICLRRMYLDHQLTHFNMLSHYENEHGGSRFYLDSPISSIVSMEYDYR